MSQLTTIDTNNFAAMAKAMGIAAEADSKSSSSTLARLRINHTPVMGMAEVNGKNVNVEVVEGCLLYTSPSPRDISGSRMPSSA